MPKRYAICNVVGTGSDFDPWRPAIADAPVRPLNWAALPAAQNADGTHTKNWMLVIAAGSIAAMSAAEAMPGVVMLPNVGRGERLNMDPVSRQRLEMAMSSRGMTPEKPLNDHTMGELALWIGKNLQAHFSDLLTLDVSE